jgi:hypothetical protein
MKEAIFKLYEAKREVIVFCIVITRNGRGDAYKFPDKKAARLHPLVQMYDVVAEDAMELAAQFGKDEADALLRFAEGRDRARLIDAFEIWKSEPKSREFPFQVRELFWSLVVSRSKYPPKDPAELLSLIVEDRQAVEGGIRSRGSESNHPGEVSPNKRKERTEMSEAEAKTRKARVSDDAVISILVDKNPKREGSKAAERFAYYKDGMTVKVAKEAGVTSSDIRYDTEHNYISVTEPAAA